MQVNKQRTKKSDNHRNLFLYDKRKNPVSCNVRFVGSVAEAFPPNAEA